MGCGGARAPVFSAGPGVAQWSAQIAGSTTVSSITINMTADGSVVLRAVCLVSDANNRLNYQPYEVHVTVIKYRHGSCQRPLQSILNVSVQTHTHTYSTDLIGRISPWMESGFGYQSIGQPHRHTKHVLDINQAYSQMSTYLWPMFGKSVVRQITFKRFQDI